MLTTIRARKLFEFNLKVISFYKEKINTTLIKFGDNTEFVLTRNDDTEFPTILKAYNSSGKYTIIIFQIMINNKQKLKIIIIIIIMEIFLQGNYSVTALKYDGSYQNVTMIQIFGKFYFKTNFYINNYKI